MNGRPPHQAPAWVRLVNEGAVAPLIGEAMRPFRRERLMGEACATTGLADFGPDDFLTPLDLLLADLEEHAALTVVGRWQTHRYLQRLLRGRLQLVDALRRDPGIADEVIDRPILVAGAPRTGTSILHALLALDPAYRAPAGWELLLPAPPPRPRPRDHDDDPRVELADAELRFLDMVGGGSMDAIHLYGARLPKECLSAHSFAFRSQEFPARYHVPNYTRWLLDEADMTPAYAMHRLVLRTLQRHFPHGRRWVLKSPVHLHSLDVVHETYPDATVVVTHRDPLTVLGSVTSLIATLRAVHSDTVDFAALGRYHADLYFADLDGLVDADPNGTVFRHVAYPDLVGEPVRALRELYAGLDTPFDAAAENRVTAYLAARPKDKHGAHHYTFEDLGLDRTEQQARFARYREHFGSRPTERRAVQSPPDTAVREPRRMIR